MSKEMAVVEKTKKKKARVMWCTDGPTVVTGFGRVSYELITRLLKTDQYEIVCMSTNDRGQPHPLRGMKNLIIEPLPYISEDPYGFRKMPELLKKYQPDLVFSLNDIWVWTADERRPEMLDWFIKHLKSYKPYIPWVGYFPVDGRPWTPRWRNTVNAMDFAVVYSDYGVKVMKETPGVDMNKVKRIYHGSSDESFKPLDDDAKKTVKQMMQISPDTFLAGCVARNQPRKAIPRLIQAFKMFTDGYVKCNLCNTPRNLNVLPDCEICGATTYDEVVEGHKDTALYLHMNIMDLRGFKIPKVIADNQAGNVITRPGHNVADGVSIEELNKIYNAFDVHILPTLAGGFELPVIEAQAAGTPNIATRTTAVTELMDNELGYMVLPETHIIMEDANHCYKHLISMQGLLDALEMAYQDWKGNTDRRKKIIANGLQNAKDKNWDIAAEQFDKLFQLALSNREPLHKLLATKDQQAQSVVFVNDNNDPSRLFSMLPAIKKIVEQNPNNIIVATKKQLLPLMNDMPELKTINIDRMWLDDSELRNCRASIHPINPIIDKFESGSINCPEKSWAEVYAQVLKVPYEEDFSYKVSEKETQWAKKMLDYNNPEKTYRILTIVDTDGPNIGLAKETWNQVGIFTGKFDDTIRVIISDPGLHNAIESDIKLSNLTLREIFALVSCVDCVVTSNESYIYLANIFKNIKFVFIQGARDNAFNTFYDNVTWISEKIKYPCMPCWKQPGMKCKVSGNIRAQCMNTISAGEIFAKILRIKKSTQNK